jgi:hypothetical protein
MRKIILALSLAACCFSIASAQETLEAFAQKDDTYLLFSDKGIDESKTYVLFNFWNPETPNSDVHNAQFQTMKSTFSGYDNIQFVNIQWGSEKDIQTALEKYEIESVVEYGKNIRLKDFNFSLNTSSTNSFFLLEDKKPAFLCSGGICAKKMKQFFLEKSSK